MVGDTALPTVSNHTHALCSPTNTTFSCLIVVPPGKQREAPSALKLSTYLPTEGEALTQGCLLFECCMLAPFPRTIPRTLTRAMSSLHCLNPHGKQREAPSSLKLSACMPTEGEALTLCHICHTLVN